MLDWLRGIFRPGAAPKAAKPFVPSPTATPEHLGAMHAEIEKLRGEVQRLEAELEVVRKSAQEAVSREIEKVAASVETFKEDFIAASREVMLETRQKQIGLIKSELKHFQSASVAELESFRTNVLSDVKKRLSDALDTVLKMKRAEFEAVVRNSPQFKDTRERLKGVEAVLSEQRVKLDTVGALIEDRIREEAAAVRSEVTRTVSTFRDEAATAIRDELAKADELRRSLAGELEKATKAQAKLAPTVDAVAADLKDSLKERQQLQKQLLDLVDTVQEIREDLDNVRAEVKQDILSTARRLTDDEDSDISAVLGHISELKAAVKKLEKVSGNEVKRSKQEAKSGAPA